MVRNDKLCKKRADVLFRFWEVAIPTGVYHGTGDPQKSRWTVAPALEDRDGVDVMADAVPIAESLEACQAVCLLNESCTGILATRLPCGSFGKFMVLKNDDLTSPLPFPPQNGRGWGAYKAPFCGKWFLKMGSSLPFCSNLWVLPGFIIFILKAWSFMGTKTNHFVTNKKPFGRCF